MWGVSDGTFAVLYLLLALVGVGAVVLAMRGPGHERRTLAAPTRPGSLGTYDIALLGGANSLMQTVLCALWEARLVRISPQGRVSRIGSGDPDPHDPYATIALDSITTDTSPRAVLSAVARSSTFTTHQDRLVDLGLLGRPSVPAHIKIVSVIIAGIGVARVASAIHHHTSSPLFVLVEVAVTVAISAVVVLSRGRSTTMTKAGRTLHAAIRSGATDVVVPEWGPLAVAVRGTKGFRDPSVRKGMDTYFDTGVGAS